MLHTYVIICMVLNPTMCTRYEIEHYDYTQATSQIDCLKGGVIFGFQNPIIVDRDAVEWRSRGGVRCEADPPRVSDIQDWLKDQKDRRARLEPQIK